MSQQRIGVYEIHVAVLILPVPAVQQLSHRIQWSDFHAVERIGCNVLTDQRKLRSVSAVIVSVDACFHIVLGQLLQLVAPHLSTKVGVEKRVRNRTYLPVDRTSYQRWHTGGGRITGDITTCHGTPELVVQIEDVSFHLLRQGDELSVRRTEWTIVFALAAGNVWLIVFWKKGGSSL